MKTKNRTLLNVIINITLQMVTIISGFIIPKLILNTFGSEVNGLVSSLTQFLNYITLFEGGLSAVVTASLYKPLFDHDEEKISAVMVASIRFYRKLSMIFIGYTVILAIVYPFVVSSPFSFFYIFVLTLILSINMFVQYCFSISYRMLLKADHKLYIASTTQIIVIILNTLLTVVMIKLFPSIHIVKFVSALVYLLQPISFIHFTNKYFKLDLTAEADKDAMKQRWNGFGINLAAFIHNNTDIVVLTLFTTLKTVSVYAVYALVTQGLKNLITALSAAIVPSLGRAYASGDPKQTLKVYKRYELIINFFTFLMFTVGGIMITPFVLLYTTGITDTNYNQPLFGILIIMAELVFCLREPSVNMAYSAGKFKEVTGYAVIEAAANIIISVILVNKFGLIGVSIGTLTSMSFRTLCHIYYLKKDILHRPMFYSLLNFGMFALASMTAVILSWKLFSYQPGIVGWIIYGFENSILVGLLLLIPAGISSRIKK